MKEQSKEKSKACVQPVWMWVEPAERPRGPSREGVNGEWASACVNAGKWDKELQMIIRHLERW